MKKTGIFLVTALCILIIITGITQINPVQAEKAKIDPVKHYVSRCTLQKPVVYKNLTIYPVNGPTQQGIKIDNLYTLDEAMKKQSITVKEVSESGSVNELAVWNKSDKYVFIMAGEILAGAKQDRVLHEDVLLPPDSGKVLVKAFCVERGRWARKSDSFYSESKTANISVRQAAKVSESQAEVWDQVGSTNKAVAADAPTDSLSRSFEAPVVKEKKEDYTGVFKNLPTRYPEANGVIVMVNNRVLVADIFNDRNLFEKLWPKLVDSYVMEAISRQNQEVTSDIKSTNAFLEEIKKSGIRYLDYTGTGKKIEIKSPKVSGSGILKNTSIVHLDIFPVYKPDNKPPTSPIQRNYRNRTENPNPPNPQYQQQILQ